VLTAPGAIDERALLADLRAAHDIHTAILYGSRARGDATAESDIDIATFSDAATTTIRDARLWHGTFLDGFVYPTAALVSTDPDLTKLLGGRILADDRGLAPALLARLAALDAAPVAPLAADEAQMRRVWYAKTLARIAKGDLEAHYRRHWLLFQLLEDHFALRARRYPGPKRAFAALAADEPAVHALFAAALAPGAPHAAIVALVTEITRS
jgi:hypothetical protein